MNDESMQDLVPDPDQTGSNVRRRVLRSTVALPSLVTLANGIAGFGAIHFATKPLPPAIIAAGEGAAATWIANNLVIAAWMIFVGMVFDALDGRIARMTGQTSEFGAQLDSLCDAVTFGIAPAILMLRTVQAELFPFVGEVDILPQAAMAGRAVWFIAAVYSSCAILRLARFNVENTPDLSSHLEFKGMPSPAAAMTVASLVLLHAHLPTFTEGWRAAHWLSQTVIWAIPVVTLASALLMVSQVRFPHLANKYLGGRKSFRYLVCMAIIAVGAIVYFRFILVTIAMLFLCSGPVNLLWRRIRRKRVDKPAEA